MNNRKGMTLIEVIISMMLLSVISIAILPIAGQAMKFVKWNNIKLNALNLAYSQGEWLKTLTYKDLGLDISGYSPHGMVKSEGYLNDDVPVEIDGVQYRIHTNIYWEEAVSSIGEPVPQAMKKTDVTVEARDLKTGAQREYALLGTLISREGERDPTEPGHVIIKVYLRSENDPVKNVTVGLGKKQPNATYTHTDEQGRALFGNLSGGNYTIEPIHWKGSPLMVEPDRLKGNGEEWESSKEVTVPQWERGQKDEIEYPQESFKIDLPGRIKILGPSPYPKDSILTIWPSGESYIPIEGESPDHMTLTTRVENLNHIKFWRLWNYEFRIFKESEEFFLEDIQTKKIWDGRFDMSKLNKESLVQVDLKFAIKDGKIIKDINDQTSPVNIIINFTSNLSSSWEDIESELILTSNESVLIPNQDYKISLGTESDRQLVISLNGEIEIGDGDLEFKISNYESIKNSYGMSLAQEKSTIMILSETLD